MRLSTVRIVTISIILTVVCTFVQDSSLRAAPVPSKGVPATQQVEVTGLGATQNEAFKQAVMEAVRQVVGTLVTAENVVNNDRIIKDEVLTLSNGFIEKVISQEKIKQKDGTWAVKLNCIVRKGQVYGSLQKANVPTIKLDGTSIFADVVSQLDHQESSVKMIQKAMETVEKLSLDLVTATVLEGKPRISERKEDLTWIAFDWAVSLDVDGFFKNCAPVLDDAFGNATSDKGDKLIPVSKDKKDGVYQIKQLELSDMPKLTTPIDGRFNTLKEGGVGTVVMPIAQEKNKWKFRFYQIDRRILSQLRKPVGAMVVTAHFYDDTGEQVMMKFLQVLRYGNIFYGQRRDDWDWSFLPVLVTHRIRTMHGSADAIVSYLAGNYASRDGKDRSLGKMRIGSHSYGGSPEGGGLAGWFVGGNSASTSRMSSENVSYAKFQSTVEVPTAILPQISKIKLSVRNIGDWLFAVLR